MRPAWRSPCGPRRVTTRWPAAAWLAQPCCSPQGCRRRRSTAPLQPAPGPAGLWVITSVPEWVITSMQALRSRRRAGQPNTLNMLEGPAGGTEHRRSRPVATLLQASLPVPGTGAPFNSGSAPCRTRKAAPISSREEQPVGVATTLPVQGARRRRCQERDEDGLDGDPPALDRTGPAGMAGE